MRCTLLVQLIFYVEKSKKKKSEVARTTTVTDSVVSFIRSINYSRINSCRWSPSCHSISILAVLILYSNLFSSFGSLRSRWVFLNSGWAVERAWIESSSNPMGPLKETWTFITQRGGVSCGTWTVAFIIWNQFKSMEI